MLNESSSRIQRTSGKITVISQTRASHHFTVTDQWPFSRLVTLSISSLRNLDIEANKFYKRAHQLMMLHFLPGVTLNMLLGHI